MLRPILCVPLPPRLALTLSRPTFALLRRPLHLHLRLRPLPRSDTTLSSFSTSTSSSMSEPSPPAFERMAQAGVPQTEEPSAAAAPDKEDQAEGLPELSAREFRVFNRMAEHMDMFHENFRRSWNLLHGACTAGRRPANMSLRAFLATGEDFCHHLTIHHTIEEQHIFPVLATKMPAFRQELELLTQHRQIHEGLEKFEVYLGECRSGERELRLEEMGRLMEGFGGVLWAHLDDEVRELRAENMRRFWSVEEMVRMPM